MRTLEFNFLILQEWSSKDVTAAATYIIILSSLIFNIFIFCYIGELVAEGVRLSLNYRAHKWSLHFNVNVFA